MAAIVTGSKTVSTSVSPSLTGAALTALMAIAVENMTVGQLRQLQDAVKRVPGGAAIGATMGSILT